VPSHLPPEVMSMFSVNAVTPELNEGETTEPQTLSSKLTTAADAAKRAGSEFFTHCLNSRAMRYRALAAAYRLYRTVDQSEAAYTAFMEQNDCCWWSSGSRSPATS
jgi:hypothetical protein